MTVGLELTSVVQTAEMMDLRMAVGMALMLVVT